MKTINISTWNDFTSKLFLRTAVFKDIAKTVWKPTRIIKNELKQFENEFGFVTNKEIVRCDGPSHVIKSDSIIFSNDLILSLFLMMLICSYFFLAYHFVKWNGRDWERDRKDHMERSLDQTFLMIEVTLTCICFPMFLVFCTFFSVFPIRTLWNPEKDYIPSSPEWNSVQFRNFIF